jgi:CBS domain containing-hemolysin-like protein
MFVFLLLVSIAVFCLLVVVTAMEPKRIHISHFELHRRAEIGDASAKHMLQKLQHQPDIESILKIKVAFLLVLVSFLIIACFGWIIGPLIVLIVLIEYGAIAQIKFIKHIATGLYNQIEPFLYTCVIRFPSLMRVIKSTDTDQQTHIASRQELEHMITQSHAVLSDDEKKLVVHSLAFSEKTVQTSMTAVNRIMTIKKSEFLGPLTLSELHQTGHSRLPVIGTDINHIVGILHLQNLLALDIKRSVIAEKAMDTHVLYIRTDQTLPEALAVLLHTHEHLLIVINEDRQTVGLITIHDVLKALIGRSLVDTFDNHESIRAVAERQPETK